MVNVQQTNPLLDVFSVENARVRGSVRLSPGECTGSTTLIFQPAEGRSRIDFAIPSTAADWSACGCLRFPFYISSPARWFFDIVNDQRRHFEFKIQPLQDIRIDAVIPGRFLHHEYTNNRRFKAYTLVNWNPHIDLTHVASIIISMRTLREVRLTLGPLAVLKRTVPDAFHLEVPVIDRFGQWIEKDESPADVLRSARVAWSREDDSLSSEPHVQSSSVEIEPSGYFRTAKIGGRWWLVEPQGRLFFSAGLDCVRLGGDETFVSDRKKLFAKPRARSIDFYKDNTLLRYGKRATRQRWTETAIRRLRNWGFNSIGLWSAADLQKSGLPFVVDLNVSVEGKSWHGFPDVFAPEYPAQIRATIHERIRSLRENRFLLGYFLGNEPRWQQRSLIDAIDRDPVPSATQRFVRQFLLDAGGDDSGVRDKLSELLARRHFQVMSDALRALDPNHLNLGIRWVGRPPESILRASDIFDVFTVNMYSIAPSEQFLQLIDALVGKPVLIGEFHFGATGRGLGGSLIEVRDQEQRGVAYQYYLEHAAANPSIIGAHYFQFKDQPVAGRFDGENFNIGFVDVLDRPYETLVAAAQSAHARMYAIHEGVEQPSSAAPERPLA